MESRSVNRRKLGAITAIISLIVALAEGGLSLIRTKAILIIFGDSTNAIMQVAVQITAYLVLIESGMTAAYQLKLYKPLEQDDIDKVSALFFGLKRNLRNIAIKMTVVVNVCSLVYVFFLLNINESRVAAFSIFFVMGLRFVSPYLLTLEERTILIANEKGYVSIAIQGILQCVTLVLEIMLCKFTELPLAAILCSYIVGVLIAKFIYVIYRKRVLRINFNYLVEPDFEPSGMTKDILMHQVSGMISSNTDNILLSIMSSLTNVTIYSAFSTVMNYPALLLNSIIGSMKASVIIKVQKREKNAYYIYENVLKLSCLVMSIFTSVFFVQINNFVSLWIGNKYILENVCVLMFSIILFMNVVLNVLTIGVDAEGLYKETKMIAVGQAATNLGLTLLFIPFWGIKGALIGTVVSVLAVKLPFMSRIVYRDVFKRKNQSYKILLSGVLCTVIASVCGYLAIKLIYQDTWIEFIVASVLCGMISLIISVVWYLITDKYMMRYYLSGVLRKFIR